MTFLRISATGFLGIFFLFLSIKANIKTVERPQGNSIIFHFQEVRKLERGEHFFKGMYNKENNKEHIQI